MSSPTWETSRGSQTIDAYLNHNRPKSEEPRTPPNTPIHRRSFSEGTKRQDLKNLTFMDPAKEFGKKLSLKSKEVKQISNDLPKIQVPTQ